MNAVEIEQAVSDLANAPFDPEAFPYAFLTAFGVKETTIARLRKGDTNASDVGGVLQRGNIHIAVTALGSVNDTLRALRESPKTAAAKAKFILATDGQALEAEDLISGEPLACAYPDFADHFGFFLPLAGISTVKELKNNPIDVKATGRLNRLYVELLKENADWGTPERRHDLNQFMARLIFCFFAEDTGIFNGTNLFTSTLERMSTTEVGSVEYVLTELFRAMDVEPGKRQAANLRSWADVFPYVNGGLFTGGKPSPRFSKIARSYLLRAGELNWQEINPDIFGSMIQAVADDSERGSLGMHYTSVPNIMKVLGPLFLDDLNAQLETAGANVRKLRNLRKRLGNIRVFDPACGSGNFLVISYIRMREIEHEIVKRTDDEPRSLIPLANFYGIEIKDFAAEIARLALLIAEFQCDVRFINQQIARSLVLPLKKTGQIHNGNALAIDWSIVCPTGAAVLEEYYSENIKDGSKSETQDDETRLEVETYICGNPPYLGSRNQSQQQKDDLEPLFLGRIANSKSLDYVSGWLVKAADYAELQASMFAFVTTNSLNQGLQVPMLWPLVLGSKRSIIFAHRSFKWNNLAANNAGVTVSIVGVGQSSSSRNRVIYEDGVAQTVKVISPYLIASDVKYIEASRVSISGLPEMVFGNMPRDGGHLSLNFQEKNKMSHQDKRTLPYIYRYLGSDEMINGLVRYCLWIKDSEAKDAEHVPCIAQRLHQVAEMRASSSAASTRSFAHRAHRFVQAPGIGKGSSIIIAGVSSERRQYLPVDLVNGKTVASNLLFSIFDAELWNFALIASRLHMAWISTVCGKMKTDFRYSNTLGWNTFPVPVLTDKNKSDLEKCAENILHAREEHFPATIADLYDPDVMPDNVRRAHQQNDEILEQIYIGRLFRNDTERVEKLFELYTKLALVEDKSKVGKKQIRSRRDRSVAGVA